MRNVQKMFRTMIVVIFVFSIANCGGKEGDSPDSTVSVAPNKTVNFNLSANSMKVNSKEWIRFNTYIELKDLSRSEISAGTLDYRLSHMTINNEKAPATIIKDFIYLTNEVGQFDVDGLVWDACFDYPGKMHKLTLKQAREMMETYGSDYYKHF